MRETKEKQIGETRYRVTMLGAKQGRRLFAELFKYAGPAFGELIRNGNGRVALSEIDTDAVATALQALADRLDVEFFDRVVEQFAASTQVHNGGDRWIPLDNSFDLHFAGKYRALFQWLAFCCEVNFADFLDSLKATTSATEGLPDRAIQ